MYEVASPVSFYTHAWLTTGLEMILRKWGGLELVLRKWKVLK